MPRTFVPKVITANDLFEGDVIYLTSQGKWSRHLNEAHVAHSEAQAATMLELAKSHAGSIVGAYAADVVVGGDGTPEPLHFREAFRTRGPSNYFHGKQADTQQAGQ